MNIRPLKRLLLATAIAALPAMACADDAEDITVYGPGEGGSSLYRCLIADLPTISFADGTLFIKSDKGQMSSPLDIAEVGKIVFGVKPAEPAFPKGDVNGDRTVDVADIATVISIMAGSVNDELQLTRSDVNSDGTTDVADIATIITVMASQARLQK